METMLSGDVIISFLSLTLMEIVLGIDNIIFISILTARLPEHQQQRGRVIGLLLALLVRIGLLFAISWLVGLQSSLFTVFDHDFSGRDLILMAGGLFLLYKSTTEIHGKLEGETEEEKNVRVSGFSQVIFQIILLDIVFSFDSILTAIGLVDNIWIMVAAVIISIGVMLLAAKRISDFIHKHPTLKMLALAFLLLIGVMLILDGWGEHVPKGYIYFAIFFSLFVEFLNIRTSRKAAKSVELKQKYSEKEGD
ncbi:TerC family protein [Roseivirga sp. BDSF3-8]|uniref:TerC family protein n=1 Tax=Roseivirga sp. BDSF3-8 TaxID=3241598 RepID=UPI003531E737